MAHLQLTCLGDFHVMLAGAPLTAFSTDKARALLVYLALEGRVHQRDDLARFFWPGYSDSSARNSLRQALHQLRQLLPDPAIDSHWLLLTRQTVQLNPAATITVDVTTFTGLLAECAAHPHAQLNTCQPCLARLRQAVDLHRGDFLAGFTVADSDPFEEWRRVTQEQLHIQMLDALTLLADAAEATDNGEEAMQAAQRQLTLEPWREAAHRQIMRILAQRGQRVAAMAQYQRCRQVLAEELGVEPDAETTALSEEIECGDFDRVTRRQGDKVTESPSHPVSPPHLVPAPPSLPVFPTPLVGRAQAMAEITHLLQRPEVRLLTLVGPGGMGKTRLAVEIGRDRLVAYRHGVFFVSLAAISTPSALALAIATTLGIAQQGSDPRGALLQKLRQKQMLLILDNFEHLLVEGPNAVNPAIDLVLALLDAAPELRIIVTSREHLNLRSEQIYQVKGLDFSPTASVAEASVAPALRLFVQVVQRTQPDFQLSATNLPAVLRICQLVQGMPLGLELAAAHSDILPLAEIAREIERSSEFLRVDWRDLPVRQRSMRAVFTWSWQLLDEQERHLFRRLALFQGGFTRIAAESIAGATLSLLIQLIHKSLIQRDVTTTTGERYQIHELLRQFAIEELAATMEEEVTANRHSEYYLALLAAQQSNLLYHAPYEAMQALQPELGNIRQAWRWGVGHLPATLVEQSALTLREFYWLSGLISEGIEMFALAIPARQRFLRAQQGSSDGESAQTEARLYGILQGLSANFFIMASRHEEAFQQATEALQFTDEQTNPEGAALLYLSQGQALRRQGKSERAQQLLMQVVQLAQSAQKRAQNLRLLLDIERRAYSWLASIALSNDEYATARTYMSRHLDICRRLQKFVGETMALTDLVDLEMVLGDYALARQHAEQALTAARKVSFRWGEASCLAQLADIIQIQGDYSQAQELYKQVVSLFSEMGYQLAEALAAHKLGRLYLWLGERDQAQSWIERAFHLLHLLNFPARETYATILSRAWFNYLTDNPTQALVDAEEGWRMARQLDGGANQAQALVLLGLIRQQMHQATMAATAFHEALTIYQVLGHLHQTVEPRAGLARLALAADDPARALAEVEAILPILQQYPLAGATEPFRVYLTCYTVLAANNDARAILILERAHALLTTYAGRILDPSLQRSFLGNVAIHQTLQQRYAEVQAQRNRGLGTYDQPVPPLSLHDWGEMPAVDFFAGRAAEMAQLTAWLAPLDQGVHPAQLISILGMGGIGKTTLAAAVSKAMTPHFTVIVWRSLLNAPPPNELLHGWLQILSRQTLTALPDSFDEQLRLLLTYLGQERCLLVLDNVESIFTAGDPHGRAGVVRPGYEGYEQLLHRLASSDHQSCLLLTSREQPYVLNQALLGHGHQAQPTAGRVRLLALSGLDEQAGCALLRSNGLNTAQQDAALLVENYSGNPLALQIVAGAIADFFGGDVAAFEQEADGLFDGIRLVLDQQFVRLSTLERDILVWLAIEREPITVQMLRSNLFQPVSTRQLIEALHALQNRSLLEKKGDGLTLQNVIIEYTTDYLVEQVCREIVEDKETRRQGDKETGQTNPSLSPHSPFSFSFLNRFALLKAQAKAYVRQSQERLIVQPLVERLTAKMGKAQVGAAISQLLDGLRAAQVQGGYAAGNLLNLLLALQIDGRGFDFSGLKLREAFLQGKTIHNINFRGADLTDVVFTDSFSLVNSVTINPAQTLIAAGTGAGEIRLWHYANRQPVAIIQGKQKPLWAVIFSPDGRLLASSDDQTVQLWEIEASGERVEPRKWRTVAGHSSDVHALAFSFDGKTLASGSYDQSICLWDVESGALLQRLHGHSGYVYSLAFSPDGRLLASGSDDQTVRLWDLQSQQCRILQGHRGRVYGVAFQPQGRLLATCSTDHHVCLWDVARGELCQTLHGHTDIVRAVAFHPTGAWVASGGYDETIRIWSLHETVEGEMRGEINQILHGHVAWVRSVTFSPDGKTLISGSIDSTIRMWGGLGGFQQAHHVLHGHSNLTRAVAISPDGVTLVSGSSDHAVRIWDMRQGGAMQVCQTLLGHTRMIRTLAFHPSGQLIASGGFDKSIRLWAKEAGEWQLQHTLIGHTDLVRSVAFSPDGIILASAGSDQTICLWDVTTGRLLHTLCEQNGTVWSVAFHPNGQTLASGSADAVIRLWQLDDRTKAPHLHTSWRAHEHEIKTVAFSPDGQTLASGSDDKTIRLWKVHDPLQEPRPQQIFSGHRDAIWSLAFSPDGQTLASCSADKTIRLWNLHSAAGGDGSCRIVEEHTSWVWAVAFSPDGQTLVSCSDDETIRLWDLSHVGAVTATVLRIPGPYAGMNIRGVTGISAAQQAALRALGAVEE